MDESGEKEKDDGGGGGGEKEKSKWIRRKGRSEIWKHLKVDSADKTCVQCDYCPSQFKFSSSTTNLMRHLKEKHHLKFNEAQSESGAGEPCTSSSLTSASNQQSIQRAMSKMGINAPKMRDQVCH